MAIYSRSSSQIISNWNLRIKKTNPFFNLKNEKNRDKANAIEKIYSYAKELDEPKYQMLIKKF